MRYNKAALLMVAGKQKERERERETERRGGARVPIYPLRAHTH
jgi:hypothetical protein